MRFLNRLTEKQPINSATLERYLLLAQDVPGVTLRAVLEPSADQPGALNLIAQVSRKAVSGLASIDNRAFNETGPIEMLGVIDLNSFTEYGEKTEFSFYHTLPNSENFGQASLETFVGSSGLKLKFYAGYGVTNPTGSLGAIGYQGLTTVFGTQLTYPVIRARQQTLNVYAAFDGIESNISTTANGPRLQASYDSLRVLRFGEDYALSDIWLGANHSGVNAVSARISQGLPILGATTNPTARVGERTDFFKFNFEATRTQTLFVPWDGASVGLMGLFTGQWSDDILPPSEQFYLGGVAIHAGLLFRAGSGRQGAGGDRRAATEHRLRDDAVLQVVQHRPAVLPVLRLGRDLAEPERRPCGDDQLGGRRCSHAAHARG